MNKWEWIQWPAMLLTLAASWLVASESERRRKSGFWVFLSSNALWVIWGASTGAYGLVVLQLGLAVMNTRGMLKNDR
jgi:hypothetical protein